MGHDVSAILNPDNCCLCQLGLAKIEIVPIHSEPVDPGEVFRGLEDGRCTYKTLPQMVTNN